MYNKFYEMIQTKGITPYRVAKETGISTGTLSDWKRGRSTPKVDKLMKIADFLDVPLEEFVKNEFKGGDIS